MNNQEIADKINADIKNGVYIDFEKLGKQLEKIAHKLVLAEYVENRSISYADKKTLVESGYLTIEQYNNLTV